MKKIYTITALMSVAFVAAAQQLPEAGKYYYLVNGHTGTYSANEQRPNACFGVRTQTEGEYFGMQDFAANDEHLLWTFVAKGDGSNLYAMVNKAGEYVPALGIIYNQNGSVNQDTRYEIGTLTDGVVPDDAYGFILTAEGAISETHIANYNPEIHGMQVGDTYITIRPEQYNNNGTTTANSNYYLNAAGSARQFVINLWATQGGPGNSQYWIMIPGAEAAVAPEVPVLECSIEATDGEVVIPYGGAATVSVQAEVDAQVAYAFVENDGDEPQYSVMSGNTATLRVDRAGVLSVHAVRSGLTSDDVTLKFTVGDEVDGISELAADKGATRGAVRDLQGRVVANPTTGIYIINGKKTLIK